MLMGGELTVRVQAVSVFLTSLAVGSLVLSCFQNWACQLSVGLHEVVDDFQTPYTACRH